MDFSPTQNFDKIFFHLKGEQRRTDKIRTSRKIVVSSKIRERKDRETNN